MAQDPCPGCPCCRRYKFQNHQLAELCDRLYAQIRALEDARGNVVEITEVDRPYFHQAA